MLDTISTVRTGTDNHSEPQQECSGRVDPKMRVRADSSKLAHSKYLKTVLVLNTLDTFILASKKFHAFWFSRLINYFNVSYLGFSPL